MASHSTAGRQVSVFQGGGNQQTAKGRHTAETIPFIESKEDCTGFAVTGNHRSFSVHRRFCQR